MRRQSSIQSFDSLNVAVESEFEGTCRASVQLAVLLDVGAGPTQVAAARLQCVPLSPVVTPVSS